MIISIKNRSTKPELMDDFSLQGRKLQKVLEDLSRVNKWLGGNKVTIDGLEKLLANVPKDKEISIADIGCGNGTVLKQIAKWGRTNGYNFKLTGIDYNENIIKIAQAECIKYQEINLLPLDVLNANFKKYKFDIITTTLTLHHFSDEQISSLLNQFVSQSHIGCVINDLERSLNAYYLFLAFSAIFLKTKIARRDGLTSILRAFKKEELWEFANKTPAKKHEINWCWAFRYQWIIYNNERTNNTGK